MNSTATTHSQYCLFVIELSKLGIAYLVIYVAHHIFPVLGREHVVVQGGGYWKEACGRIGWWLLEGSVWSYRRVAIGRERVVV